MSVLDILITGDYQENWEKQLEHLTSRYDSLNIYCIGNPHEGIHDAVTEYAFRHICPLTLGTAEDKENMLKRLSYAEHAAVLIFGEAKSTEEIRTAEWIKEKGSFQARYIV